MIVQDIITQSNNNSQSYEAAPQTTWGAALDGEYPLLNGMTKSTIFIPTTENVDTYNHHIQSKQYYGDDIHVIFSTHEADEKGFGSRIRYSKSVDNGLSWSSPIELLESQDDPTKDFTTERGRQSIAVGFGIYNDELYAIVSVDELGEVGEGEIAEREGIGMIAVKVNSNSTFGTPYYIDTPQSDFIAPTAYVGYPQYTFNTNLRSGLRDYFINNQDTNDLISYFSTSVNDPIYARTDYLTNTMSEPTSTRLPNGQYFKLWKLKNNVGIPYKIGQTSNNGINWGNTFLTNIPDTSSRNRILTLSNGIVVLLGNNQDVGGVRDPLYIALSHDGLNYTNDNTYQIDNSTYGAQFSGEGKGRGAQHPSIIELNNGRILVTYNWNKEEVYSSVFDTPIIDVSPITWGAANTGNYPSLTGLNQQYRTIFSPSAENVQTYNFHPFVIEFGGYTHIMFSTSNANEENSGQYVRYTKSNDEFATQETIQTLFESQDDVTKLFEDSGRVCVPSGFVIIDNELYGICDVNDRGAGGNPRSRTGVGLLVRKINLNGTFGDIEWFRNADTTYTAPLPVSGYPSYNFNSALTPKITQYLYNNVNSRPDWYYSVPNTDYLFSRIDPFNGGRLVEPRVTQIKSGQYLKIWRYGQGTPTDKYAQSSNDSFNWSDPYLIEIPDSPSRTSLTRLNNGETCVIGNNNTGRVGLFVALSESGLDYSANNVYNIDFNNSAPVYSGHNKAAGCQYPFAIQLSNGRILAAYSIAKEDIKISVFDKPIIN